MTDRSAIPRVSAARPSTFAAVASLALLTACDRPPPSSSLVAGFSSRCEGVVPVLEDAGAPPRHIAASDLVEVYTLGLDSATWLDGVWSATFLADGNVMVSKDQAHTLSVHDGDTGAHIRNIGGVGDGPGEFRQVAQVAALPDGRIAIWDSGNARRTVYAPDGSVLESESIRTAGFLAVIGLLPDGRVIAWQSDPTPREPDTRIGEVEVFSRRYPYLVGATPWDTLFVAERITGHLPPGANLSPPFHSLPNLDVEGTRALFVMDGGQRAELRDFEANTLICFGWGAGRTAVDAEVIARMRRRYERPGEPLMGRLPPQERRLRIFDAFVESGMLPDSIPPFGGVKLDGSDFWVAPPVPDRTVDPWRWYRVNERGAIEVMVDFPARETLSDVAGDRLVVTGYGPYDEEYVRVYALPL